MTEGIKYAGSKRLIIPTLLEAISGLEVKTVLDGFSGTTRVSQALKQSGYTVHANDAASYSKVFAQCYLLNRHPAAHYAPILEHLNGLPGERGWFSEHYGGEENGGSSVGADGKKKMWQMHNAMKLDAIRPEIECLGLSGTERAVLITSLMLAMDRVDSSLGHQASYLRKWSPRSYKMMEMRVPKMHIDHLPHRAYQEDVFDLLGKVNVDLAYYDPPYGSANEKMPPSRVRYASYYHLWTTICLNDHPPVTGAANRRVDVSDTTSASVFEEFRRGPDGHFLVMDALERLLRETRARHIALSYSNHGRATMAALLELIRDLGMSPTIIAIDHKKHVMAQLSWSKAWLHVGAGEARNTEYVIIMPTK